MKTNETPTAKIIVQNLKKNGRLRQLAQEQLYQYLLNKGTHKIIFKEISRHGATYQDAEDLFHESFILVMEKLQNGDHKQEFSISNFMISTAKNLWRNIARKQETKRNYAESILSSGEIATEEPAEEIFIVNERSRVVQSVLKKLSDHCRQILGLWMLNNSMKDIADELSLSSERMARKYKYRCHKKLIHFLYENPAITKELIY